MKTTVERLDPVKVKLTVEVEAKRVAKALDTAAREIAQEIQLPGFRKGKAPRRLLEARVGKDAIQQHALEHALADYFVEALRSEDLDAVSRPEIDLQRFDEAEGCAFEAIVEVRPEIDLPDHAGIEVAFPDWDVPHEQVEQHLEQLRDRFAELEEVDRPAHEGDYATIDLVVTQDGEPIEGATVEDALYEIGSGGVTPKLDEELLGAVAGSELTYTDILPDDYPEHGGEEATFAVTVKDVREKNLPDLDEDFAASASEFDTVEELRDDIRRSLRRRAVVQAQAELRGRVLEAYLATVDVHLPPSLIEGDIEESLHRLAHEGEQYGLELEDVLKMQDKTEDDWREEARPQAESRVKAQLVLEALARKLDLQVKPEDVEHEILRHAQLRGIDPRQLAEAVRQQGTIGVLVGDLLRRRAIDTIVAAAEVEGGPSDEELVDLGLAQAPGDQDADAEVDPVEGEVEDG